MKQNLGMLNSVHNKYAFSKKNQSVTFVGNKAERLGIKGTKINASSTKTKVSHVNVEEL